MKEQGYEAVFLGIGKMESVCGHEVNYREEMGGWVIRRSGA